MGTDAHGFNPTANYAKHAKFSPSPPRSGRVALLGIAQRQICIKYVHNLRKQQCAKSLPESIKLISDWIRAKRIEKNLSTFHLALKMGIATALVRSWEDGTSQPDNQQLKVLAS